MTTKKTILDCIELRGMYHKEPNSINISRIRNKEIGHQLFLQPRQHDGLNVRSI